MPRDLKDYMRDRIEKRAQDMGLDGFLDKIADETVATTGEELVEFLAKVEHPALTMDPLF
jgi:CO dehydrogenase/acetyl-CoA synthase beta subunit